MEENTYNNLNRPKFLKQDSFSIVNESIKTLREIVEDVDSGNYLDTEELIKSFSHELKKILQIEDPKVCLEKFFKLEDILETLEEVNQFDEQLPSLLEFHRSFSVTALRIFWECLASDEIATLSSRFLEAFRIAIEEELYIWQEKIN